MAVATGERRIVSVLIADLVGSTRIGEAIGPERTTFLVDEVMRIMAEQVRRYDGTVAQLRGDELYAIFGAPVAHEDDSERAVRAGLAIQRAVARYAEEVQAAYAVELARRHRERRFASPEPRPAGRRRSRRHDGAAGRGLLRHGGAR